MLLYSDNMTPGLPNSGKKENLESKRVVERRRKIGILKAEISERGIRKSIAGLIRPFRRAFSKVCSLLSQNNSEEIVLDKKLKEEYEETRKNTYKTYKGKSSTDFSANQLQGFNNLLKEKIKEAKEIEEKLDKLEAKPPKFDEKK